MLVQCMSYKCDRLVCGLFIQRLAVRLFKDLQYNRRFGGVKVCNEDDVRFVQLFTKTSID